MAQRPNLRNSETRKDAYNAGGCTVHSGTVQGFGEQRRYSRLARPWNAGGTAGWSRRAVSRLARVFRLARWHGQSWINMLYQDLLVCAADSGGQRFGWRSASKAGSSVETKRVGPQAPNWMRTRRDVCKELSGMVSNTS